MGSYVSPLSSSSSTSSSSSPPSEPLLPSPLSDSPISKSVSTLFREVLTCPPAELAIPPLLVGLPAPARADATSTEAEAIVAEVEAVAKAESVAKAEAEAEAGIEAEVETELLVDAIIEKSFASVQATGFQEESVASPVGYHVDYRN